MAFNLEDHLAKMDRRVTNGERDGMETIVVHAARTYPTDALDLWDAVTNPERLSRWFLPVSGDLRLGGRYQFEGNAGGSIEECDAPRQVSVTWEYQGGMSWLTVRLVPELGATRLELEHESPPIPGFSDRFGPGALGVGWDMGFMGLAQHVDDPAKNLLPGDVDEWSTSAEAMEFYRTVSDAWGRAAVEAGTPADVANEAAETTRAFYSGEMPMGGGGTGEGD